MKWFKHEDTSNNPKLEMLIDRHGLLGHGFYFKHLELISSNMKEDNREEWGFIPSEYTTEFLCRKFNMSPEDYEKLLNSCVELNLLQIINGKICCEAILERGDDYLGRMAKNKAKKTPKKLRRKSEVTTKFVGTIEEEREEDIEKDNKKEIIKKENNTLTSLSDEQFTEIAEKYQVPLAFVRSKYDDLVNWHEKNPKKNHYTNYYRALMDWVKRDAMERREHAREKSSKNIDFIDPS